MESEIRDPETGLTESELVAYERYCWDSACIDGAILTLDAEREHSYNECEICHALPSAANPMWRFAGEPADPETGPRASEWPLTICERCQGDADDVSPMLRSFGREAER